MVGMDKCVYIVKWNGYSPDAYQIKKLFCIPSNNTFLDSAKCDPTGRIYFGQYNINICDPEQPFSSAVYSYDKYQGLQKRVSGLKVPNGLAWSIEGNYFYHIDTCFYNIRKFRWNSRSGELCKHRAL